MVNDVNISDAYSEIYIHVPSNVGNTPVVLFETLEDSNYKPNLVITGTDEFINGRNSSTIHPDGLGTNAFYDYDAVINYTDPNAEWALSGMSNGNVNSYFTEPINFDDPSNTDIKKYPTDYNNPQGFSGVAYRRSKLDGITIDWNGENYFDVANDSLINDLNDYNLSSKSKDFEFNAILVYYDIYDVSAPNQRTTNLYGVLFLDNITPSIEGGYIQRLPKFKPNTISGLNGNSYGTKINIKFDSNLYNGGLNTLVNDYNTFSMGLFGDAIAQLQHSVRLMQTQNTRYLDIVDSINKLENQLSTIPNIVRIQNDVNVLRTRASTIASPDSMFT
jgi:hypothetical protein